MIRKLVLLSAILMSFSVAVKAQFLCGATPAEKQFLLEHPELAAKVEANNKLMEAIADFAKNKKIAGALAKTTGDSATGFGIDTFLIPVAVHVIHNYGTEDVSDADIYTMIKNLNIYYNARNTDLPGVIAPFKKYIGNMRIGFHLATKDPTGQPTRGITRRASYLTRGGDNYAKFDLWDPSSYLNIWVEDFIGLSADVKGSVVAAYSQLPDVGGADPFIDGLITGSDYIADGTEAFVISHEVGHYLGLLHPFGNNNQGCAIPRGNEQNCGDDGVDDTPPTSGEFCGFAGCGDAMYDTLCATGYLKFYPVDSISVVTHQFTGVIRDSLQDYPDTANVQNIMTYSPCDPELMFTKGQVARVHSVLQASLANRDSLSTISNLINTGIIDASGAQVPLPVLPPVADYALNKHFVCMNSSGGGDTGVGFFNHSWNDSIKAALWTLPSYASKPSSTNVTAFASSFSKPGWVPITLTVTGPGGTSTIVDSSNLYVADNNALVPSTYMEEFNPSVPGNIVSQYPMFNYFHNEFKWIVNTNTGYFDNSCIQYVGFDYRIDPNNHNYIGIPKGDSDDMYTPAYDLTSLDGGANIPTMNFMFSAASRVNIPGDINDTLEIDYNIDCAQSSPNAAPVWAPIAYLTKGSLINYGAYSDPFRPTYTGAWSLKSIPLKGIVGGLSRNAISNHTIFRFRYKPGVNLGYYLQTALGYSTGNNFYMDRLNFSNYPSGLNTLMPSDQSIIVAPNPTNGDAFVMIAGKDNITAQIQVTDIAGRVVYTTAQQTAGGLTRIAIPKSAIQTTGMYLVHVIAGEQSKTEKLVVY